MRKKLLLGLFLIVATISSSYAQTVTTHLVKPSEGLTTPIEINDSVKYDDEDILGLLDLGITDVGLIVKIECTSAPAGVNKSAYTQQTVLTLSLVTDLLNALLGGNPLAGLLGFNDQTFSAAEGDYEFTLSRFTLDIFNNPTNLIELKDFTIDVGPEGTLSLKNVENTPEFSVFSKDGIVTVNNTNDSAVTGMAVYSISGAQIYKSNTAVSSIDLSAVANGVYILTVQEGASVTTKKFIKS